MDQYLYKQQDLSPGSSCTFSSPLHPAPASPAASSTPELTVSWINLLCDDVCGSPVSTQQPYSVTAEHSYSIPPQQPPSSPLSPTIDSFLDDLFDDISSSSPALNVQQMSSSSPVYMSQPVSPVSIPQSGSPVNCSPLSPADSFSSSGYSSYSDNSLPSSPESSIVNTPLDTQLLQHLTGSVKLAQPTQMNQPVAAAPISTGASLKQKLKGKPPVTYIELIARALLSSSSGRLALADIYEWIIEQYPYYQTTTLAWRNAIRHNLSVTECFIKAGRTELGRGYYWAIHPSCIQAFSRGDFRRGAARSRVQKLQRAPSPLNQNQRSAAAAGIQSYSQSQNTSQVVYQSYTSTMQL